MTPGLCDAAQGSGIHLADLVHRAAQKAAECTNRVTSRLCPECPCHRPVRCTDTTRGSRIIAETHRRIVDSVILAPGLRVTQDPSCHRESPAARPASGQNVMLNTFADVGGLTVITRVLECRLEHPSKCIGKRSKRSTHCPHSRGSQSAQCFHWGSLPGGEFLPSEGQNILCFFSARFGI